MTTVSLRYAQLTDQICLFSSLQMGLNCKGLQLGTPCDARVCAENKQM